MTFKITSFALSVGLLFGAVAQAQTPFAKPEAAADAFIDAVASSDGAALQRVLGKGWAKLVPLGDVSAEDRYSFLEKAHQARSVTINKQGRGELLVGTDPWALPIPLLQGRDGQWRFDLQGARLSVLERRIGANEHAAIQALLASVDAQREYAQADRNNDGVLEYAQRIISTEGRRDGLIWADSLGDESPLGEEFAPKRGGGYHGYHFKLLSAQGEAAAGGARSYLIGPRMVSGFAMLAWPVKYGDSGVMSFMVNQDGQVFEADLGPNSAQAAAAIKAFNPGQGWQAVAQP